MSLLQRIHPLEERGGVGRSDLEEAVAVHESIGGDLELVRLDFVIDMLCTLCRRIFLVLGSPCLRYTQRSSPFVLSSNVRVCHGCPIPFDGSLSCAVMTWPLTAYSVPAALCPADRSSVKSFPW